MLTLHVPLQLYSEDFCDQIRQTLNPFCVRQQQWKIKLRCGSGGTVSPWLHPLSIVYWRLKKGWHATARHDNERDTGSVLTRGQWMDLNGFILISWPDTPFHATSCCPEKVDVALRQNVHCKQNKAHDSYLRQTVRWMV